MCVASGGTLIAWKILDFELPRNFSIAILATKTVLCQLKSSITLENYRRTPVLNFIYIDRVRFNLSKMIREFSQRK